MAACVSPFAGRAGHYVAHERCSTDFLHDRDRGLPDFFRNAHDPAVGWDGYSVLPISRGDLPLATWLRLMVWLAIGLGIYFGYGHRHSVVRKGH